jgi:hypothetical protein
MFAVGYDPAPVVAGPVTTNPEFLEALNNRARVNAAFTATDWLRLDASYGLSFRIQDKALFEGDLLPFPGTLTSYRVDDLRPWLLPKILADADHTALFQNLDRLFVTVSAPAFDLFIGRQAIAWGSAHAVNPTDIIAPYLYNEIDTEDRIGVDAVRLRVPTGQLGEVDLGYVAGEDFESDRSAAFARLRLYALETDVSTLLVSFQQNLMAGIDLARAIGGASWWLEAGYVWVHEDSEDGYLRLSTGADFHFASGVYTFLEYHFNQAGSGDPQRYLADLSTTPYREGAVYLLGEHYLAPGASWTVTPLITASGQALINLSDGSVLIAPVVEYNVRENAYLSAGAYAGFGKNPTYSYPLQYGLASAPTFGFQSEFGAYPDTYYLSARFYY